MVSMVDQNATYLTRRRGVHYYYARRIPKIISTATQSITFCMLF